MRADTKLAAAGIGDIRRLAESFEIALAARNLSPRTMQTSLDAVGLLAAFLERSGMPTRLDAITREHVEAFVASELERVSPTSVHIRFRGLQQFFGGPLRMGTSASPRWSTCTRRSSPSSPSR